MVWRGTCFVTPRCAPIGTIALEGCYSGSICTTHGAHVNKQAKIWWYTERLAQVGAFLPQNHNLRTKCAKQGKSISFMEPSSLGPSQQKGATPGMERKLPKCQLQETHTLMIPIHPFLPPPLFWVANGYPLSGAHFGIGTPCLSVSGALHIFPISPPILFFVGIVLNHNSQVEWCRQ